MSKHTGHSLYQHAHAGGDCCHFSNEPYLNGVCWYVLPTFRFTPLGTLLPCKCIQTCRMQHTQGVVITVTPPTPPMSVTDSQVQHVNMLIGWATLITTQGDLYPGLC